MHLACAPVPLPRPKRGRPCNAGLFGREPRTSEALSRQAIATELLESQPFEPVLSCRVATGSCWEAEGLRFP